MKLTEIHTQTHVSGDTRLGVVGGLKFILKHEAGDLPAGLTITSLRSACRNFADRLELIIRDGIEVRAFYMHLTQYNVVFFCAHNIKSGTIFLNTQHDSSILASNNSLSVVKMSNIYEVFDNSSPMKYREFTVREDSSYHSLDQVKDRGLQKYVTHDHIEQILKEAIDKINFLNSKDFYVKFAQVYSMSAQQGLIIKVKHDTKLIVIKTYLPHASNEIKSNCVMIKVN
jgi:hypothetical protein